MAAPTMSFPTMAAPTMPSSPSPAETLDRSPTPPPSDPKSGLDSLPDGAAAAAASSMPSSPSAAETLDRSTAPPSSDPKSDLDPLPDGDAAADQPGPSVPSVGESDKVEGDEGAAVEGVQREGEEEEVEECGFCIFMKKGGCEDSFVKWENCVETAEENGENMLEKCAHLTRLLRLCMDAHADYYEPILRAEAALINDMTETMKSEDADAEEEDEEDDS